MGYFIRVRTTIVLVVIALTLPREVQNQGKVQVFGQGSSAVRFTDDPNYFSASDQQFDGSSPIRQQNSEDGAFDNRRQASRRVHFPGTTANDATTIGFGGGNRPGRGGEISFGDDRPSVGSKPLTNFNNQFDGACVTPDGEPGSCLPYVQCGIFIPDFLRRGRQHKSNVVKCLVQDGRTEGICCKTFTRNTASPRPPISSRFGFEASSVPTPNIDRLSLEDSVGSAQIYFNNYNAIERRLLQRNLSVKRGTSSYGHLLFFRTSRRAIELSRVGLSLVESTRQLRNNIGTRIVTNDRDFGLGLRNLDVRRTSLGNQCPAFPRCNQRSNRLRNVDGSCNNLEHPMYGAVFTPLIRLVRPQYADGIWSPRVPRDGGELPSARLISASFNQDVDAPNNLYSLWVMQFGQFLDHDLSHVPIFRYSNGSGIECCNDGDFLPITLSHPQCLPIEIPANDGFYRPFRQRCMNFVRSMLVPRPECTLGYADQLNQITAYLDSSNVYGSTQDDHQDLRDYRGGKLKTDQFSADHRKHKGMLPFQINEGDECTEPNKGRFCFNAGDLRVNEMIGLTVTHLVWFREHNRIAASLQDLNPGWSDDRLFDEARRILNAEYQHIIYNEWLPIVVGTNYMEVYGILPQSQGYYKGYDPTIDPGVSNAFSAAAFRMGHTLIQGLLPLINEVGRSEDEIVIHEHFNKPFRIRERRMVDKLLRALSQSKIQSFDRFVTSEVTNRLFQEEHKPFGMDLISLNIQRGRDHGIPGYNTYRELCQLKTAQQFGDFQDWISPDIVAKLASYYRHVDDVDLFVGGILERPLPGALLGPTFTCIIGDQFARARKGDRFFYDNGPSQSSFTSAQLQQIRRASFSRILCDNSDDLKTMQPFAFLSSHSSYNPVLDCNSRSIPRLDLSPWRSS